MELAAFIRSNEDVIVAEWEAFAHTYLPSAAHMDRSALRDHIVGLHAPAPEIASAEGLLARACLAAGELVEAEALAKGAYELLAAWQHPDAADCLVTLALARAQSRAEASDDRIAEAFCLIDTAALLAPAEKARLKEAETVRIAKSTAAVGPVV